MGANSWRVRSRLLVLGALPLVAAAACTSSPTPSAESSDESSAQSTSASTSAAAPTSPAPANSTSTAQPSAGASSTAQNTAPGHGNIGQVVPSRSVRNRPVVALTASAEVESKVTVRLSSVRRVTTKAQGPGEVAGPGVSVGVVVTNKSARPVSLRQFAVTLEDSSSDQPATPLTARYTKKVASSVGANSSAAGTYAFTTGHTARSVLVTVTYSATAPTVRFVGTVR